MANAESKALQAKEKAEVPIPAEQTKPGVVFTPAVDIFETDTAITLVADLPGVAAGDLDIGLDDNVLTLSGDVYAPGGPDEMDILTEYRTGKYYRQFTLAEIIDREKIGAELKNGVLRLTLPKVEAATPRKIAVKAG
jgi:HSP20 family protein